MATSEREPQTKSELVAALAAAQARLEQLDEIENPIERFFKQEQVLEQQDWLEAEIAQADETDS